MPILSSPPAPDQPDHDVLATATFGGGCFWCLEAIFCRLRGVVSVESGYSGGHSPHPDYAEVCTGDSGHAEVVRIRFAPQQISYGDLLDVFFAIHDPTTPDRQGNDIGSQYRSLILTHSAAQAACARQTIARLTAEQQFSAPIVTRIEVATTFHPAEADHQNYYANNPHQAYCLAVIAPKLVKFLRQFADRLK
ncbi:MAG: peptide-methionine (S)-S-oxide reductase MsrA [Sterolibacterium sp.]|nr:peptide-methionine (S)-S-oxide reductase MsrA [Sterolibacterium sp.]